MLKNINFGHAVQVFVLSCLFMFVGCESSLSPEEGLQRAGDYRDKGNYDAAVIELKNVLTNNPDHSATRLMLGELYLLKRDGYSAATHLRKANEAGLGVIDTRSSMGKALLLQEEYGKLLNDIVVEEKDDSDVRVDLSTLRAYALFFKRDYEQADQLFMEVLKIKEKYPAALVGRAMIKLEIKNYEDALQLIEHVLAVDNENMDAWVVKGQLALGEKQFVTAEEAFRNAISAKNNEFTFLRPVQPYVFLVQTFVDQGKISDANQVIKNLAKINSKNPLLHYLRALIAYESSDFEAASEHIQVIRSVAPDFDAALILEGAINYSLGRLERGNSALTSYLTLHPESDTARKLLAATRMKLEQPQQAYDLILPMLEEDPDNIELLLLAGDAMRIAGKPAASIPMIEKALEQDPGNPELKMQLALARLANDETDEAIRVLLTIPQTKDKFGNREMTLLIAWSKKKDYASALSFADEYIAAHPDDAIVLGHSGVILSAMGKNDAARERFEKALSLKPDSSQLLMALVRLEYKEKQYARAEEMLIRLNKIQPENASVLFTLANVSSLQGKTASGIAWLEKSAAASDSVLEPRLVLAQHYIEQGELTKAREVMLEAKKIAPYRADVWNAYSVVQNMEGDKQGAIESLRKAEKLKPGSDVILMNLSKTYISIKDYAGAADSLYKLLKFSPEDFVAASMLAITEMKLGNADKAIAIAKNQQLSKGNRMNGLALEGDMHMMVQNYSKAIDVYREAAESLQSVAITVKLHSALREAGDAEAESILLGWLKNHPEDMTIRILLANYYMITGDNTKSVREFETLLVQKPDNPDILNNLALSYFSLGDPRAVQTAEKAHNLAKDSAAIKDTYGWILVQENDAKKGAKLLGEAVSKLPDNVEVNYHYAVALDLLGDKEKARSLLQKILDSKGDPEILDEAKKYLQTMAP